MGADHRGSWLDRLVMSLAPGWGLRRLQARASASMLARHYDAASGGRRTAGWHRRSSDANAAAAGALVSLRELSRDLRRNNGWAKRGIRVIGNNVVGWGIEPKSIATTDQVASRAIRLWHDWSGKTDCDYDGRLTFSGLQRLVMDTVVESGEALVLRERGDSLAVPLRVRVLEPDYLDVVRDGINGPEGPIVQGVELDGRGRRVAYWLYSHHPGATSLAGMNRARFDSVRVPATDVIHVYRVDRPSQMRGVPWLASAIAKLHDFDEYDDALLLKKKIEACFAAFVQDLDGLASPVGEAVAGQDKREALEPGQISYLPPGKSITFAAPPSSGDHGSFSETALRRIAVSLDVTYEDLTGDYSKVNFSSARMARLSHFASVHDWRWNMLIPQLCDGVWGWVMELAAQLEGWPEVPSAEWSPPPMPMLEPDKEGLAYQRLMRSGVMTLAQVIRERGEDPASHLKEIADANRELDALGIWLDSDPRRTSAAGLTQERGGGGAGQADDEGTSDDEG